MHYTTLVQRCRSTNAILAGELEDEFQRLERVIEGEREARHKLDAALRGKDHAVSVLMDRCQRGGVDISDLIP